MLAPAEALVAPVTFIALYSRLRWLKGCALAQSSGSVTRSSATARTAALLYSSSFNAICPVAPVARSYICV